jgi:hypothetical protein
MFCVVARENPAILINERHRFETTGFAIKRFFFVLAALRFYTIGLWQQSLELATNVLGAYYR